MIVVDNPLLVQMHTIWRLDAVNSLIDHHWISVIPFTKTIHFYTRPNKIGFLLKLIWKRYHICHWFKNSHRWHHGRFSPERNDLDEVHHKREGSCKAQRTIKVFLIYSPSGVEPLYKKSELLSYERGSTPDLESGLTEQIDLRHLRQL